MQPIRTWEESDFGGRPVQCAEYPDGRTTREGVGPTGQPWKGTTWPPGTRRDTGEAMDRLIKEREFLVRVGFDEP